MRSGAAARTGAALAILSAAASCGSVPTLVHSPSGRPRAEEELAKVDTSDGISRREAEAIASYFFHHYAGVGCGALGWIREADGAWRVDTWIGVAAEQSEDIVISKRRGSVSWGGRHCADDPLSMLSAGSGASRAESCMPERWRPLASGLFTTSDVRSDL